MQVLATLLPSVVLVIGMFVVMLLLDPVFTAAGRPGDPAARGRDPPRAEPAAARRASRSARRTATLRLGGHREPVRDPPRAGVHPGGRPAAALRRALRGEPARRARVGPGAVAVRPARGRSPASSRPPSCCGSARCGCWTGHLSLGVLLVFLSYLGSLYKPVKLAVQAVEGGVSKGLAAAERIGEVLDAPMELVDAPRARAVDVRGRVEFAPGHLLLRPRAGAAGPLPGHRAGRARGAGRPDRRGQEHRRRPGPAAVRRRRGRGPGRRDRRARPPAGALRGQIATVLQDTVLLDGTLRDNIICGRPGRPSATSTARRGWRWSTSSPRACPTAWTPASASAVPTCPAGSASGWRSPERSCATRRS